MRLDKYLSKALSSSRSEVHKFISDNRIKVNGTRTKKKDLYINEEIDTVLFDDLEIEYREFVYIMLNKPSGVVSAVVDKVDRTVVDLIKEQKDVFPIGRLDKDTEGLIILSNNGKLAHNLTSPKHDVEKKYYVELEKEISESDINKFETGLVITDGKQREFTTKPARFEKITSLSCYVYISEGKFHQIKKMFIALGNEVKYLKRIAMGNIVLDDNLQIGEYRYLTDDEVRLLKSEL